MTQSFDQKNSLILPKLTDGSVCLKSESHDNLPKVAVISLPKAGTYFMGTLLKELGFIDLEIHAGPTVFDDYRGLSVEEKRDNPQKYRIHHFPIEQLTPLIRSGQFIVGHLPSTTSVFQAIQNFKRVFIYRDLRDCLVSDMRFLIKTGRPGPGKEIWGEMGTGPNQFREYLRTRGKWMMYALHKKIIPWVQVPNTLALSYETLQGDHGTENQQVQIDKLIQYLGIDHKISAQELLERVNAKETLTRSGNRSSYLDFQSDEVDALLNKLSVLKGNAVLGYET